VRVRGIPVRVRGIPAHVRGTAVRVTCDAVDGFRVRWLHAREAVRWGLFFGQIERHNRQLPGP